MAGVKVTACCSSASFARGEKKKWRIKNVYFCQNHAWIGKGVRVWTEKNNKKRVHKTDRREKKIRRFSKKDFALRTVSDSFIVCIALRRKNGPEGLMLILGGGVRSRRLSHHFFNCYDIAPTHPPSPTIPQPFVTLEQVLQGGKSSIWILVGTKTWFVTKLNEDVRR